MKKYNADDVSFAKDMIAHHTDGLKIARAEQANGTNTEMKVLAGAIITTQEREIEQMKRFLKDAGESSGGGSMHHM